jgi:hypothetical protein
VGGQDPSAPRREEHWRVDLGGLAGEDGSPQTTGKPKAPSTRGRQLLYFEALKNKNAEKSSISWRGNDVWAHEQIKQGT